MIGALSGLGVLPLEREDFKEAILRSIPRGKLDINLKAYDIGRQIIKQNEDGTGN
jgi:indolepyruvate ferredoxin oxidoreductase beta subunit